MLILFAAPHALLAKLYLKSPKAVKQQIAKVK
jgi:hypothetical protein